MHVVFRCFLRGLAGVLLALVTSRLCAQAPVITLDPLSQTNRVGTIVTFETKATGAEPLTFNYYFNGTNISTFTNGLVSLAVTTILQEGNYVAIVTNALGAATSAPAVLTVIGPPAITSEPTDQTVYVGQSASFSVTAISKSPETYQWFFRSVPILDATNSTLTIREAKIEEDGTYQVRVSNINGTTPSLFVVLRVNPLPDPTLSWGAVTATNRIRVPVLFAARGTETNLSFSASFDPAIYTNAEFVPDLASSGEPGTEGKTSSGSVGRASLPEGAVVVTDSSQLALGRLGVAIAWPTNNLPPGANTLGQMVFDLVGDSTNAWAGKLAFTNEPLPALFGPPRLGNTNIILTTINPQIIQVGGISLNRQTGYLFQELVYVNPGNTLWENSRLTVSGLGKDTLTNRITLANSQGTEILSLLEYVDLGAIAPTEVRGALLEYYVTDRVTTPTPVFNLFGTPAVDVRPPRGDVLTDVVTRTTNNMVLVEFPTQAIRRYYIEYATNLAGFTNGAFSVSLPSVNGTGSRVQWLDSGPPRTSSPPLESTRFYRVIEAR